MQEMHLLHHPSEYTRNLDCEQIFEYASRWRGTLAELASDEEPKTPFLNMGRPLVTNWGMRFQSPDKHLRSSATSGVYLGKTHPRFLASPPQKTVPFSLRFHKHWLHIFCDNIIAFRDFIVISLFYSCYMLSWLY